jgi:putative cell wall-binding protein
MKRLLSVLVMFVALLLIAAPAFAAEDHICDHNATTVESLHHCVVHAYNMGHITNAGVRASLLAKLDAAQAAFDTGQTGVAIRQLNAFVNEIDAQADKAILAEHAGHLVEHAQGVIAALDE